MQNFLKKIRGSFRTVSGFSDQTVERADVGFEAERFIRAVWQQFLGREPDQAAIDAEASRFLNGHSPVEFFFEVSEGQEAVARRNESLKTRLFVPPGHYYSPVVDPSYLRQIGFESRPGKLAGVDLDLGAMSVLLDSFISLTAALELPVSQTASQRYYSDTADNVMYGQGDAYVLAGMIRHFRPSRFVEIGSGFSSALVLDTLDDLGLNTVCTFIDPYPHRLKAVMRPSDHSRVRVLEMGVQETNIDIFRELEGGDVLFLDTTHISKTGSDVNFEIFEILPILKRGVIVHFHDVFDGFEYPDLWIFEDNRSWNEQYMLRSFLMFNRDFRIVFFNDHVFRNLGEKAATLTRGQPSLGGGLWLVRD